MVILTYNHTPETSQKRNLNLREQYNSGATKRFMGASSVIMPHQHKAKLLQF